MGLITWNKQFSVNVSKFDEQHKELIRLINELHEAMLQSYTREVMGSILLRLTEYALNHFKDEELLMEQYNYPEYIQHKNAHQELVLQVKEIVKKQYEGVLITTEVMNFLKSWLSTHILGEDKAYGAFFNTKGVN